MGRTLLVVSTAKSPVWSVPGCCDVVLFKPKSFFSLSVIERKGSQSLHPFHLPWACGTPKLRKYRDRLQTLYALWKRYHPQKQHCALYNLLFLFVYSSVHYCTVLLPSRMVEKSALLVFLLSGLAFAPQ